MKPYNQFTLIGLQREKKQNRTSLLSFLFLFPVGETMTFKLSTAEISSSSSIIMQGSNLFRTINLESECQSCSKPRPCWFLLFIFCNHSSISLNSRGAVSKSDTRSKVARTCLGLLQEKQRRIGSTVSTVYHKEY